MVSATPSAVPERPAKLERMSLRTTPVWLRTLAPLEPSPGYGPAVSSGILLHEPLPVPVSVPVSSMVSASVASLHPNRTRTPAPCA